MTHDIIKTTEICLDHLASHSTFAKNNLQLPLFQEAAELEKKLNEELAENATLQPKSSWCFQILYMFIPIWRRSVFTNMFQMG